MSGLPKDIKEMFNAMDDIDKQQEFLDYLDAEPVDLDYVEVRAKLVEIIG